MARYRFEVEVYSATYSNEKFSAPGAGYYEKPIRGFFFEADTAEEARKMAEDAGIDKASGMLGGPCLRVVGCIPINEMQEAAA